MSYYWFLGKQLVTYRSVIRRFDSDSKVPKVY
jgi:hypothetical protein